MIPSIASALLLSAGFAAAQTAGVAFTDLIGTWSTKSNSTFTGPKFYNPVEDTFTEPAHTGISYSFSVDGFYEEAYYRAISNPQNPKCPKGIMQWQHGTFTKEANGSLILEPIKVDGRQLYSDPCSYDKAIYTRYNTSELFSRYEVMKDGYTNKTRLNLYKFDGAPMIPMYLALSPPDMLPTSTLNPLTTSTPGAKPTAKARRSINPLNNKVLNKRSPEEMRSNQVWWFGVFLTASGGVLYWFF
ncbi:chaperone for protein-folding within the ER, fungal-domain-containing protein [Dendryphion nanum]|uniref:Protein ROT1 n=1 Tax=Dendryphion nanum TaxID=256645 RepID=A0A9P9DKC0_9PLEO|nr:chaperone for protein-folding within the ER, fungal-domain-containing protein [Dendryphion nanum]